VSISSATANKNSKFCNYVHLHNVGGIFMSVLYKRIDTLCKQMGTTVTAMCRELDISRSSLTELKSERTKSLSSESLLKIANYFKTSVDSLLFGLKYVDNKKIILNKRNTLKMSQIELSKILGISVHELDLYEQGHKFMPEIIYNKISDFFNLTPVESNSFLCQISFDTSIDDIVDLTKLKKEKPTTSNSDKLLSDDPLVNQIIEKLNSLSPELKKVALAQLDSLTKLQDKKDS
jgi:transcriptional regulator with XRE-family HTH domain